MIRRLALILTFCLLTPIAAAGVYKSIDENGKVIYTDNPHGNQAVEKVDLPRINSQPAIQVPAPVSTPKAAPVRHSIEIQSPRQGAQISTGQTEVRVFANITPHFNASHRVVFSHNGKVINKAAKSTSILLDQLHRGEHQISVKLIDKHGKVIARSKTVTFFVQRHSVNRAN
jgi:Domain of unknown function (DUF4124)